MRLLSYNIHGCVGRGGTEDPARVLEVIRTVDADVVALQEVHDEDATDRSFLLALEAMETYPVILDGSTMRRGDARYGNVLLSRHPVRSVRRVDLSVPGREPRGAIQAVVEAPEGEVGVMATHLGLWPAERRAQIRRLRAAAARKPARGISSGVRVLIGDFNEWLPLGRPARMMRRWFGVSPWRATFPARFPLFALDRVWVHPKPALRGVAVLRKGTARLASDHLPLVAEVDAGRPSEPATPPD